MFDVLKLVELFEDVICQRVGIDEYEALMPNVAEVLYSRYCVNTPARDVSRLMTAGNKAQLEKLRLYSSKPPVDDMSGKSFDDLFKDLTGEVAELKLEIHGVIKKERDPARIRAEAADVSNYSGMIILKCDEELSK